MRAFYRTLLVGAGVISAAATIVTPAAASGPRETRAWNECTS